MQPPKREPTPARTLCTSISESSLARVSVGSEQQWDNSQVSRIFVQPRHAKRAGESAEENLRQLDQLLSVQDISGTGKSPVNPSSRPNFLSPPHLLFVTGIRNEVVTLNDRFRGDVVSPSILEDVTNILLLGTTQTCTGLQGELSASCGPSGGRCPKVSDRSANQETNTDPPITSITVNVSLGRRVCTAAQITLSRSAVVAVFCAKVAPFRS
uniref:Uncharacterized protein n=1 Tax=Timema monikensis TaxID=170555 RepID=A0A7R9EBD2_9NEOP|nr:unnamed protein product [Timema monikensis]